MNEPKTFEEVQKFLSNIPSINGGGCGIAAFTMYKWLKKHGELNYGFRFVACYDSAYDDENRYINNMKVLRTKEGKAMASSHIAITNGGPVLDCNGYITLTRYDLIQFIGAEWFITNMINNTGSWNPSFDREHIRYIEQILDLDLSEIKEIKH